MLKRIISERSFKWEQQGVKNDFDKYTKLYTGVRMLMSYNGFDK